MLDLEPIKKEINDGFDYHLSIPELRQLIEEVEALRKVYQAGSDVVKQFNDFKNRQHELLDRGLEKACENWDEATQCSMDFNNLIESISNYEGRKV